MKSIKIAGLCLAAMFVMSMAAAGTASAAPHWLVCLERHEGSTATRWETHQCEKASASGAWEWSEASTEYAVKSQGTLTLLSTELGVTVELKCSGTDAGFIGPKNKDRTTTVTVSSCTAGKNCEKVEKNAEAVNLPWTSELLETEGKIHDTIRNSGAGNPGWRAACKTALGRIENECTSNEGLTVLENQPTPGAEAPLLVLASFISPNKPKANCSSTGKESGEVLGNIAVLLTNNWGLRVSK